MFSCLLRHMPPTKKHLTGVSLHWFLLLFTCTYSTLVIIWLCYFTLADVTLGSVKWITRAVPQILLGLGAVSFLSGLWFLYPFFLFILHPITSVTAALHLWVQQTQTWETDKQTNKKERTKQTATNKWTNKPETHVDSNFSHILSY
jgi:hypothetical protein